MVLEPNLISSQRMTAVYYVEVAEKQTAKGWSPVTAEDAISAGDQVKLILRGFFPFQPVALYFDEDISVQKIHDASERQVVAIVKVKKGNPKIGWHDLQVQDCERQSVSVPQALYVSAGLPEAKGGESMPSLSHAAAVRVRRSSLGLPSRNRKTTPHQRPSVTSLARGWQAPGCVLVADIISQ